ncbi:unnamed protein product [Closterium sp. Yama58-4]|nr:unnamed protein product [Closterium sp. Yama58-4]
MVTSWPPRGLVGGGDAYDAGRVVVMCIIVSALVILPVQLSNISNLLAHRPYGGRFSAASATGMRFVVLTGQLSPLSIQQFLAELYHPLHDKALMISWLRSSFSAHPLTTTLSAPPPNLLQSPPTPNHLPLPVPPSSFELRALITEYHGAVRFIQGSPMTLYDLHRVQIALASAVFILLPSLQSVSPPTFPPFE